MGRTMTKEGIIKELKTILEEFSNTDKQYAIILNKEIVKNIIIYLETDGKYISGLDKKIREQEKEIEELRKNKKTEGNKKEAAEASGELKCKCGDTNKEVLEKIERQDAVLAEFIEMCMTFMSLQMTYNMQSVAIMQNKGEFEELPEMSQTMVEAGLDAMESFVNSLVNTMENVIKKRPKVKEVKDVDIEELMKMFGTSGRTDN